MRVISHFRRILPALLLAAISAFAADYENPLAVIAANPQLSESYNILKRTGYAEPLGAGGDITFLVPSNKLLNETIVANRFSYTELFRNKIPLEAQLLILQGLTLDGQYTQAQLNELVDTQGSGKAALVSVLGEDARFWLFRGKTSGSFILEDASHKGLFNGLLITSSNEYVTQNGIVIVIDATAAIPK